MKSVSSRERDVISARSGIYFVKLFLDIDIVRMKYTRYLEWSLEGLEVLNTDNYSIFSEVLDM